MTVYAALLRGVNVGGHNKLPMAKLRAVLTAAGFADVKTYIQSGNIVFGAPKADKATLAKKVASLIDAEFGFSPPVLLLTQAELAKAEAANPFAARDADEKVVHLFFLAEKPAAKRVAAAQALAAATEQCHVAGRVLYLRAPDGIARSKLAASIERTLGVAATGRNLRTVRKILELVIG